MLRRSLPGFAPLAALLTWLPTAAAETANSLEPRRAYRALGIAAPRLRVKRAVDGDVRLGVAADAPLARDGDGRTCARATALDALDRPVSGRSIRVLLTGGGATIVAAIAADDLATVAIRRARMTPDPDALEWKTPEAVVLYPGTVVERAVGAPPGGARRYVRVTTDTLSATGFVRAADLGLAFALPRTERRWPDLDAHIASGSTLLTAPGGRPLAIVTSVLLWDKTPTDVRVHRLARRDGATLVLVPDLEADATGWIADAAVRDGADSYLLGGLLGSLPDRPRRPLAVGTALRAGPDGPTVGVVTSTGDFGVRDAGRVIVDTEVGPVALYAAP